MPQARQTPKDQSAPAATPGVGLRFDRGERRAAIAQDGARGLATWDGSTNEFEFVLATEAPCRTWRWDERTWLSFEVDEVLSMAGLSEPELIVGAPILDTHSSWRLNDVLGVIVGARVEGDQLICRGRLSPRAEIEDIRADVAAGILRNMSVGFQILAEDAPLMRGAGEVPLVNVTSWRCCEASIVPVPADPNAQTRSRKAPPMAGAKPSARAKRELTEEEKKRAEDEAAAAAAAAAEAEGEGDRDAVADAQAEVEAAEAALQAAKDKLAAAEGDAGTGEDEAAAEEAARAARKPASRAAADKAAVAGLRGIAERNGRTDDFDAMAAAGAPVAELRAVALTALRTSSVEIGARSGAGERAEKPKLLSFHQVRAAKAAAAANRK